MTGLVENPMGLDSFEFVEFASPTPGVLEREEYQWLYDYDNLLFAGKIDTPPGYANLDEFNAELLHNLEKWHFDKRHPLHQSVKGGAQTADHLFNIDQPTIQLLKQAMTDQILAFDATLKHDPTHPTLKDIPSCLTRISTCSHTKA